MKASRHSRMREAHVTTDTEFDAIVVGSGITGGWAAKELTEEGLKVLMIERGRMVEHQVDYITETIPAWELPFRGKGDPVLWKHDYPLQHGTGFVNEWNYHFFANERENPFQTTEEKPFVWIRGYQLGGKSLTWFRQTQRWSDFEFEANKHDGHGVDWPIRYADLSPWYDYVEEFAGISGSLEGLPQLPDGQFQPPMPMNHVERAFKAKIEEEFPGRKVINGRQANLTEDKEGRSRCQHRHICSRGCSYGAYFSTQSSTLPAAKKTGRLTIWTDSRVVEINYDPRLKLATGVDVVNVATTERRRVTARVIFVCAATLNTIQLLLQSRSEAFPTGMANSSGTLGRYLMDHVLGHVAGAVPGYEDRSYYGFRPSGIYVPRFRNITEPSSDMVRGYMLLGGAHRGTWTSGSTAPGLGAEFKKTYRLRGHWQIRLVPQIECLPRKDNYATLDEKNRDRFGFPQIKVNVAFGENERQLFHDAINESERMLTAFGAKVIAKTADLSTPGSAVHEMGGARMGRDPKTSVVNSFNQTHDVPNLFITDGSSMTSSGTQSPSLTFMALTARAAATAVSMLKEGNI